MKKSFAAAAISASVLFLSACGGGGGGDGGSGSGSGSGSGGGGGGGETVQSFQLRNAWVSDFNNTATLPFTVSGTIDNISVSGAGTVVAGPVVSATFEGSSALATTINIAASITVDGQTAQLNSTGTSYVDSNYNPLGFASTGVYAVRAGSANIPQSAQVGDSGVLYTMNVYTSSTKTTLLGTRTYSYALDPDTDTTSLLRLTTVDKNASNAVISTATATLKLTPTGNVSYVSITNGTSTGTLTFKFG